MDLDESGDDLTESESGDDDNSTESSTTEDVWHDMILEVYNTEDYAMLCHARSSNE